MKNLKKPARLSRKAPSNQTGGTAWGKKLAAEFSRMAQSADMKKLILLNFPYIIAFYMVEKAAWLYRHCNGDTVVDRLKNKDIRAAAYLRLSIEDGDKAESNSIGNQRELIRDFAAERPGLHLVEEYADDGYTGTNFERPGFKRMMEDIKSGKINCIIVKDLSRLGRNYIEMGKYLEQIFPMMGIRFIWTTLNLTFSW